MLRYVAIWFAGPASRATLGGCLACPRGEEILIHASRERFGSDIASAFKDLRKAFPTTNDRQFSKQQECAEQEESLMSEASRRFDLAVHRTHEAGIKLGGIGTVLNGLSGARAYNGHVARTILVGPMTTGDRAEADLVPCHSPLSRVGLKNRT
jgi:hypothetical protein